MEPSFRLHRLAPNGNGVSLLQINKRSAIGKTFRSAGGRPNPSLAAAVTRSCTDRRPEFGLFPHGKVCYFSTLLKKIAKAPQERGRAATPVNLAIKTSPLDGGKPPRGRKGIIMPKESKSIEQMDEDMKGLDHNGMLQRQWKMLKQVLEKNAEANADGDTSDSPGNAENASE